MITELRQKSQVTIPKEITTSLALSAGDKFEVFVKDGMICMLPVAVYPKKYIDELQKELAITKQQVQNGEREAFTNLDAMLAKLDSL